MERIDRSGRLALLWIVAIIAAMTAGSIVQGLNRAPGGHGTACSCGVSVTSMGAVSKCTCRPCKCGRAR